MCEYTVLADLAASDARSNKSSGPESGYVGQTRASCASATAGTRRASNHACCAAKHRARERRHRVRPTASRDEVARRSFRSDRRTIPSGARRDT